MLFEEKESSFAIRKFKNGMPSIIRKEKNSLSLLRCWFKLYLSLNKSLIQVEII